MNLSNIVAQLQLVTAPFNRALNASRQQVQRFSSDIARASAANAGMADRMIHGYTSLNDRLRHVGLSLRDIARITGGIMISQTFYTAVRSIREATSAMWEFNKSLDFAQVSYSALFNSTSIANDFLATLKEFSIETIYEYSDLENMARKLLAYGIEYKNLMFIIEGLTNIGTLSGDAAALERLAVAIGQINAKGYLQAEEIRQLTNAYAPMYDILQSEFGLSQSDLGRIGDLKLPAERVINAIVNYANEQFGGVADAAMYTITGLNNRIVDSFKVLGTEMLAPFTRFYKSFAFYIAEQLGALREAFSSGGYRAVFEQLVPSEAWQQRIGTFISSIQQLGMSLAALFYTLKPYISEIFGGLLDGISAVIAILGGAVRLFTALFQTLAANTPVVDFLTKALVTAAAAWALFRVQALAAAALAGVRAAIVGVAQAVLFLAQAILANPILTMLLLVGAALVGFASSSSSANSAFSQLVNSFNSFISGGAGANEIQQTGNALGGAAANANQFWQNMAGGAQNTQNAVTNAGNAAKKAAAGLLSFDEVFKLNQNDGSGGGGGLSNLTIPNLGEILGGGGGGGLLPEIPNFSEYAQQFVNSLFGDLWEAIQSIASGAATGGIIGALVGFAIGGLVTKNMSGALGGAKIGAKIGTIAGAGFAGFWTDTYEQMEASLLKIAGGAAAGGLVGGLIGMVIGAFATRTLDGALTAAKYGAAIGSLLGGGVGSFWAAATEEMNSAIEGLVTGAGTGALLGGLVGFVIGAFSTKTLAGAMAGAQLGAKLGTLVGAGLGALFGTFSLELQNQIKNIAVSTAEGAFIGGLAGFVLGAFITKTLPGALAGAKYGSAIGAAIGAALSPTFAAAEEVLTEQVANMGSSVSAAGIGSLIGGLVGLVIGAVVGAFAAGVGALPGAKAGATLGAAIGGLGGFVLDALNGTGVAEAVGEWFGNLGASIATWFSSAWAGLSAAASNAWKSTVAWFDSIWKGISNWLSELWTNISAWFSTFTVDVANWWNSTWDTVSNAWNAGWPLVVSWFSNLWSRISLWFTELIPTVKTWWSRLWRAETWTTGWNAVTTWFSNLWNSISTWFTGLVSSVKTWWNNLWATGNWSAGWSEVASWFSNLLTSIGTWFVNLVGSVRTWWSNLWSTSSWGSGWSKVTTWFSSLLDGISTWFTGLASSIKTWWNNLWKSNSWTSGWGKLSSWFSDLRSEISNWFSNLGSAVSTWWNNLWKDKKANVSISSSTPSISTSSGSPGGKVSLSHQNLSAYASGGIVTRDQIARVAEGNKREAIIPLENEAAMRPFSDAVSNGIIQSLMPVMASISGGSSNNLPPMYVGTLIADERGLTELYKKFELYEAKEQARKGLA